MKKKKKNSVWILLAVAVLLLVVALPHLDEVTKPEMATEQMCMSAVSSMSKDGTAISGSMIPITPCCVYDDQITSCVEGYPYDGVLFIADLVNTGSVDVDAHISTVVVTPVDKNADSELARRVAMSFDEDAYIMKKFLLQDGGTQRLDSSGLYKGNDMDQLVPAGGQAMWFTLISRTGSPNGGLVTGNVVVDYRVCASDPTGRFKETCADQEPFLLTVDDGGNVHIERWADDI